MSPGPLAGFKSVLTLRVNVSRETVGVRVWQRGYYELVIRDDQDLDRIRRYILQYPLRWEGDRTFRRR